MANEKELGREEKIRSKMKLIFDYDPKIGNYRLHCGIYGYVDEYVGNINAKNFQRIYSLFTGFY